jgi:hypothetical protein
VAQAAKGKVNSDVNAVKSWGNNAGNNVDNAAQQAKSKVSSDVNAVKSWGSSAGDAVAKNTPSINTPEVGGFFGTNPKQQADTINAKTAQKVCGLMIVTHHLMHAALVLAYAAHIHI